VPSSSAAGPISPGALPPSFELLGLSDGAWLALSPRWLDPGSADALFLTLRGGLDWAQQTITVMGRTVPQPRLTAWYGDLDAAYRYSGRTFAPLPWAPEISAIRERLIAETGHGWNGCLCNLYRGGRDSMGLHADDEPELGPCPQVASLSLGATRTFVLRHRQTKGLKHRLDLPHGSLLLMGGTTQRFWRHEVPKTSSPTGERINLTYRVVFPALRPGALPAGSSTQRTAPMGTAPRSSVRQGAPSRRSDPTPRAGGEAAPRAARSERTGSQQGLLEQDAAPTPKAGERSTDLR